jgi:hypothetical protein
MHTFIKFAIEALEVLFAVGVIGSGLVVILTSIEDVIEVLTPDTPGERHLHAREPHASAAD